MSARRGFARRIDANHTEIVSALEAVGCSVLDLSAEGRGVPDILVVDPQKNSLFIEIKTANGRLTPRQKKFLDSWPVKVHIVRSVAEALAVVGVK